MAVTVVSDGMVSSIKIPSSGTAGGGSSKMGSGRTQPAMAEAHAADKAIAASLPFIRLPRQEVPGA
jgi:L-cysteine desulfidase